ncbi:hypothetical protein B296_00018023 [Ensete ventricosum]|uniref:Glutamine amidotransferase domain-containing protein n=1 Tax=Ensete ventricosum TaxID=4639 RepID=A0A426Z0W4_ENSVE|nr:hypothetical protein B296_00018023 [Ensete ventricosum]
MGGGYGGGEAEGRRFAVLLCAEDSEYVKKVHGGYFKVFVSLLGEEGETWHVYRAARGELPPAEDVDSYDGFVISGSCSDAHGDDQWIRDLLSLLEALVSKKKQLLGVCFGHQVLLQVWELPPNAEVMAESEKTGIEMFRLGFLQNCHAETAKASAEAGEPNREAWKKLCKAFLKSQL